MKKIGIIGCGWLGIRIAKHLQNNYQIYTTTTSQSKYDDLITMGLSPIVIKFWDYEIFKEYKSWKRIQELDILIITVPFSKRASINLLKNRFGNINLFIDKFGKQMFLMSSIGIYPQLNMEIDEISFSAYEEYLNPSILFVENMMRSKYPQINILRLGGLMGDNRVFSNYETSTPNQSVNHIHYEDICLIIEKMIEKEYSSKTYNIVAPKHPTKQEIIDYQKQEINTKVEDNEKYGRRILSKKIEDELCYTFIKPDPRTY